MSGKMISKGDKKNVEMCCLPPFHGKKDRGN
jgi:hypothetical protein